MSESVTPEPIQEPVSVDDNAGSLTVDGTVSANLNAGTNNIGDVDVLSIAAGDNNIGNVDIVTMPAVDTELPAAAALADATANPTIPTVGSDTLIFNGTTWDRARGDTTNGLDVDVTRLPALVAGTANIGDVDVLTVPSPLSTAGGGTEATAHRVTIANDSTGVVTVKQATPANLQLVAQPHTSGGLLIFRSLSLTTTDEAVKATAGQVYGWAVTNTATTTRWLKFYNATAANVTVGTTTPVITWGIPGNTSDDISANALGAMGIEFATAITVAATTGVADADVGAPAANDVIVNIFYK